jgi:hypothetical protein
MCFNIMLSLCFLNFLSSALVSSFALFVCLSVGLLLIDYELLASFNSCLYDMIWWEYLHEMSVSSAKYNFSFNIPSSTLSIIHFYFFENFMNLK